ncbi:hypothetical protein K9M48_02415 [Candidatus Gracilibacteria bacterium]|nr:hypothetical protein [Candidatus Gracilibacteria bacterium]
MKTRENLFIEFQRELEKKRKRNFLSQNLITSLFIASVVTIASFQYFGYGVILFFIVAFILFFFLVALLTPIIDGEWDYSIKKLKDYFSQEIQKAKNLEESYKHHFIQEKEKAEKSQAFVSWMDDTEVKIITPNLVWPNYIVGLAKMDIEKVRQTEKEIENIQNQIYEFETKVEFYDQIPEKTFYQYFWSFKWLKKIN